MATTSSPANQSLCDLLSTATPTTIAEVIAQMQAIDALLPANDGLKWFNRMYLMVTQQVDENPPAGAWQNPAWLLRLDVDFAALYFIAVRDSAFGKPVPSAWQALFDARFCTGIDRIQFALAGMNAHINHDLALALNNTAADMNLIPTDDGPEHHDFEAVNTILDNLMPATLQMLATDVLGELAQDTGKIGRLLAFWNICAARDLAWGFAEHLRTLNGIAKDVALAAQDAMTGALGRAMLFGM
ncbi:MAG TPA: DUF5995 family protein [Edaphobacter sp.]|nr:DUF5995 family protein [Edaphobacter sp.]